MGSKKLLTASSTDWVKKSSDTWGTSLAQDRAREAAPVGVRVLSERRCPIGDQGVNGPRTRTVIT